MIHVQIFSELLKKFDLITLNCTQKFLFELIGN